MKTKGPSRKKRYRSEQAATEEVSQRMQKLNERIEESVREEKRPYQPRHNTHYQQHNAHQKPQLAGFEITFAPNPKYGRASTLVFIVQCLLAGGVMLGILAAFYYGVWRLLIPVMSDRLQIPIALSTTVFIASLLNFSRNEGDHSQYWDIQRLNLPLFSVNQQAYVGINLVGGLMPVAIALYQFTRLPIVPTLLVTLAITATCYISVRVRPTFCITLTSEQILVIALLAALLSASLMPDELQSLVVPAAFTSGVLGTLIGADLLHLKDLRLRRATGPLFIGGAGFRDGILIIGVVSFYIAEYLPRFVALINANVSAVTIHYPVLATCLALGLAVMFRPFHQRIRHRILSKGTTPDNPLVYLSTLAVSYWEEGNERKAEELYQQAIATAPSITAENREPIIRALYELTQLYCQQTRYAEAETLFKRGIAIAQQYGTPNDRERQYLFASLCNLADLYCHQSRNPEAKRLYLKALEQLPQLSAQVSPTTQLEKDIKAKLKNLGARQQA
ncbi:MAG: DUF1614 domain-containing protein [Cyanobacteria bacterium J06598_1]